MLGWKLFKKSISQLYYNFEDALRLTMLLWLVWFASDMAISYFTTGNIIPSYADFDPYTGDPSKNMNAAIFLAMLISLTIMFIIFSWIAILWHRYMLRNESPKSNIPTWHGILIWRYIIKSIFVGLWLILVLIPFAIIIGLGSYFFPSFPIAVATLLSVLYFTYFSLRFSLVLPAAALGEKMAVLESWYETKRANSAIFVAAIFVALLAYLLNYVIPSSFLTIFKDEIFSFIYNILTSWIVTMTGVSILTTLYGYLIEGREL